MIEDGDLRVLDWARTSAGAAAALGPPAEPAEAAGIRIHLLDLSDTPALRGGSPPPHRATLRYLVTVADPDPAESHRTLDRLLAGAWADDDLEVVLEPLAPALWTALGVAPQPAIVLLVRIEMARPQPETVPVLEPLHVRSTGVHACRGRVFGPGDRPLAGVHVEVPGLSRATRTDATGRFSLAGVHSSAPAELRVRFRGRSYLAHPQAGDDGSVIVRIEPQEA